MPCIVIADRLLNLSHAVHHEWSIMHNGFIDGLPH
ncbi:Uncharacterised protein [Vibrio cholerae]|nr:Uncharacterised protein [Vibrio cholerae]